MYEIRNEWNIPAVYYNSKKKSNLVIIAKTSIKLKICHKWNCFSSTMHVIYV